jgi:hypothetical protein
MTAVGPVPHQSADRVRSVGQVSPADSHGSVPATLGHQRPKVKHYVAGDLKRPATAATKVIP